jgi:hypothetical protein
MRAIVAVESHGYAYAVNDDTTHASYCVPGARAYPCSREQAKTIAEWAVGLGHSVDVGIAQINSSNFRAYRVTAAKMLEPCANLQLGSAILEGAYRYSSARFGNQRDALWHAIMAYNTGSLYAGERYVRAVVTAALSVIASPTVPSIAILRPVNVTPRGLEEGPVQPVRHHVRRAVRDEASPQTASLQAQVFLPDDFGNSPNALQPVVKH